MYARTFLILLCTLFLCATDCFANQWGYSPDAFSAYVEGSYFSTTQNYDPNGNIINLVNGNQFSEDRVTFSGSYDISRSFSLWAGGIFKDTNSTSLGFTRTNANMSDILLGTDFLLYSGFAKIIPELSTDIPLYGPPTNGQTGALLGDGAFVVTGKIYLTKYMGRFGLSLYGGYSYRNQGLSSLIPYGLTAHLPIRSFFIQGKLYGAFTGATDQFTNQPYLRNAAGLAFDGGSNVYNSVNPMFLDVEGDLGWFFTSTLFAKAAVVQTITGQDTALGTTFSLGIGFSEDAQTRVSERHGDARDSGEFEVDTDSEEIEPPRRKAPVNNPANSRKQAPPPPIH